MDPFVAEIRIFGCNFAPKGWAACNGQILPIAQNTALFSLLGTTYGGDGRVTFGLPNLQGRASMHWGQGPGLTPRDLGEMGGEESVTVLSTEMPSHTHAPMGKAGASAPSPGGNVWANATGRPAPNGFASAVGTAQQMNPAAIGVAGGSQAHPNLMPYQVVNYCIALQGIFPSRP